MEEPEMQLKGKKVTDKFTESVYVLANEPSVALYRLQEHVRRSLPELAQHKADMQRWEEQSQGAIYTVEYACRLWLVLVEAGYSPAVLVCGTVEFACLFLLCGRRFLDRKIPATGGTESISAISSLGPSARMGG
ncbi:BLOC-1-related complex subunit 8 isoform X1 [Phacochoerus africanus]|uniref:BLOC-1-related complex subunit 8 isoform X1 n=1 Tax=Phacochoerus africanus TaxID=41426 RepID=UPI001FD9F285|nr:BLOC-1-related complex subunit 8 isoform X1 [Phacochoerus africanus]